MHGTALQAACKHLLDAYTLMDTSGHLIDHSRLHNLLISCGRKAAEAGVQTIPKFHFLKHFGEQARRCGNPRLSATYADEGHNADIVRIITSTHVASFGFRLLAKLELQVALDRALLAFEMPNSGALEADFRDA